MSASEKSPVQYLALGGAVGLVVGCLIGWFVIGWGLWPVEYVGDAYTYELNPVEKSHYVAAVVDSYNLTRQVEVASQRLDGWTTEEKVSALADLYADYQLQGKTQEAQQILALTAGLSQMEGWDASIVDQAVDALSAQYAELGNTQQVQFLTLFASELGLVVAEPQMEQPASATAEPTEVGVAESLRQLLVPVCLLLLCILILAAAIFYLVRRSRATGDGSGAVTDEEGEWTGEGPLPLLVKKSSYRLGMDNFDESFPIEGDDGAFRGECGMGISETMGEDSPRRVLAFEVWLFDKSDIRTVTRVLMSDFAYGNENLRNKLSARGEPVLAEPGATIVLETKSLLVEAQVVEMEYGDGTPPSSYFNGLTVSMVARVKTDPMDSVDEMSSMPVVGE